MKQLELNSQKRLLIVEVDKMMSKYNTENWYQERLSKGLKLICKGSELTEEICETLISKKDVAKYQSKMCGLDFKKGFMNTIKENGYYWGENPIPKPLDYLITKDSDAWFMADVSTFDLNKTLIFEIL